MLKNRYLPFIIFSILAGIIGGLGILLFQQADVPLKTRPPVSSPDYGDQGPVSYSDAVRIAEPSVVNIYAAKIRTQRVNPLLNDPLFRHFYGSQIQKPKKKLETSLGSGVIIDSNGLILTNNHVIDGADAIKVYLSNGLHLDAKVLGTDKDTDLALLLVDAINLPAIPIRRSNEINVGDVALAIGNPFGVGKTVTMGIVSATGRSQLGINTFENFIQTDAAINPGNSGGALIDAYGNLIGINTAIFSKSGGYQGIGFAIPSDLAIGVTRKIAKYGRVIRGWLGINGQNVTDVLANSYGLNSSEGVLVTAVLKGGPAEKAGIRPGDVLTYIDDKKLRNSFDVLNIVSMHHPKDTVKLTGMRGEEKFTLEAEVAERPAE